jgi:transposase-like protein
MVNRERSTSWKEFLLGLKRRAATRTSSRSATIIRDLSVGSPKYFPNLIRPTAAWRLPTMCISCAMRSTTRKVADECLIELRWLYDRRNADEAA